jgi:hypothetical protein
MVDVSEPAVIVIQAEEKKNAFELRRAAPVTDRETETSLE